MSIILALLILFSTPSEKIKITDSWMRVGAKGKTTGLFFKIQNNTEFADTLYKVTFEHAGKVEIHETYDAGNDMMGMREVEYIVVPANSKFELKPGSFHVMLMKLKKDIKKGDEEEFILHFKQTGEIRINAKAQEMPMQRGGKKH